jgi:hypothetical protein
LFKTCWASCQPLKIKRQLSGSKVKKSNLKEARPCTLRNHSVINWSNLSSGALSTAISSSKNCLKTKNLSIFRTLTCSPNSVARLHTQKMKRRRSFSWSIQV